MPRPRFPSRAWVLAACLLVVAGTRPADGQGRNQLSLTGGPVTLVLDQTDASGTLLPASSEKAGLNWGRPDRDAKITVSALHSGIDLRLTVEAVGVQNGLPVGAVDLSAGMPDTDFIVGITAAVRGDAVLRYVARAASGSAEGTADYVVTYTLTAN